ncbi:MAG: NAD(P)/FAD-dependent oxidoreductase [Candidatus Tectimicrobiota bacterium]
MPSVIDTEICVLGGGPAGATVARKLAQLGHTVCLLTTASAPRRRPGESLPASILPLLEGLGLRQTIEDAGFLRPDGTLLHWSSAGPTRIPSPGERGFQVDRARFDAVLLNAACQSGVDLRQCTDVGLPQRQPGHGWSLRGRTIDTAPLQLQAQVLVDATGRRGLRPRQRLRTTTPTLALYGSWHGVQLDGPETRIEAGPEAWYWGAPLPDGRVNAAVFLDPAVCAGAGRTGLLRLYRAYLARSHLLHSCLAGHPVGPVLVCAATGYIAAQPIARDCLRVGDAACALDPLASQGVHMALLSALQGSIALHTILTMPGEADSAFAFYRARQEDAVARSRRVAAELYAAADRFAERPFWQRRATPAVVTPASAHGPAVVAPLHPDQGLRLSETLRIVATPAIVGDLIRRVPALVHPTLAQPVAFLGATALAPLLTDFVAGRTAEAVLQRWTQHMALRDGRRILHWLWQQGIVLPATPA